MQVDWGWVERDPTLHNISGTIARPIRRSMVVEASFTHIGN